MLGAVADAGGGDPSGEANPALRVNAVCSLVSCSADNDRGGPIISQSSEQQV